MGFGGAALKFGSTALYALEFCCAAIILGIYSYFLAVQADRDVHIPVWQQAVEGLSGAVVLYTMLAVLLTCCIGGKVRKSRLDPGPDTNQMIDNLRYSWHTLRHPLLRCHDCHCRPDS